MTQWWGPGQPVTSKRVERIASVISAGRIHVDCVPAMITLLTVFFVFITLFYLLSF
jgi:hypothetical protein